MPDPLSPNAALARLGFSGYPVYGRRSYPGSDEWHRELQGTQADRKFREILDNHGLTSAASRIITTLCQQVRWQISPADKERPAALAAAEMVNREWSAMRPGWNQVLAEMLSAIFVGWSWHEIVYRREGRQLRWDGMFFCRQDSRLDWMWDDNGRRVVAMEQLTRAGQHAIIPAAKALHFAPDPTTGSPEGRAVLRAVYLDYRDQQQTRESTLIALQKDATGMVLVRVPIDTFTAAAAGNTDAAAVLTTVKADAAALQRGEREGLIVPSAKDAQGNETGWDVELLRGGGERQIDHVDLIRMFEGRIATTLLMQFLLLGQGQTGSFALSADQTDILGVVLSGVCDGIAATFTEQAISPLCALNGIDAVDVPTLTHGPIDGPDLTALATLLREAIAAGALTPDPELEAHIRDVADLPKRPTAPPPGAADPAATAPASGTPENVAGSALNGIQIRSLTDLLADVTGGRTSSTVARLIIAASFPSFPPAQIDAMIAAAQAAPEVPNAG